MAKGTLMHVNNIIVKIIRSRCLTKMWHTKDINELGSREWVFPMYGKGVSRVRGQAGWVSVRLGMEKVSAWI